MSLPIRNGRIHDPLKGIDGEIVVKDGEIAKSVEGRTLWADLGAFSCPEVFGDLKKRFREYWTVEFGNYLVPERFLKESAPIQNKTEV